MSAEARALRLLGGPLDGRTVRVLCGRPQHRYQVPDVVETEVGRRFDLREYLLVLGDDGQLAYVFSGTARSDLKGRRR